MQFRFISAALTGLVSVAAFGLYHWTIVPLIEPERPRDSRLAMHQQAQGAPQGICNTSLLKTYFSSDHWIHEKPPKVIDSDRVMLLFPRHELTGDGRILLNPCALIFFPHCRKPDDPAPPDAVVLEAPDGAIVQVVGDFQPGEGKFGRFKSGELKGNVTIRSRIRHEDGFNHLVIQAQNVQINDRRIWSNSDVAFQLGANHGRGKDLEIRFLPAAEEAESNPYAPDIGGIQSIEIIRNVDVTIELDGLDLGAVGTPRTTTGNPKPAEQGPASDVDHGTAPNQRLSTKSDSRIRITCSGSFYFNFENRVAEFDKNVRVVRMNNHGPADQLTCQELDVYFRQPIQSPGSPVGDRDGTSGSNGTKPDPPEQDSLGFDSWSLEPEKLEAFGAPVLVAIHSDGAHAQCEELIYTIAEQRLTLKSSSAGRHVTLHWQQPNHRLKIDCPIVSYRLDPIAPRHRIGTLDAAGPGQLSVTDLAEQAGSATDRMGSFITTWTGEVHIARQDSQPVLSLFGDPHLTLSGLGELSSDEMHLWLMEALPRHGPDCSDEPENAGGTDSRRTIILPDRLAAVGNVVVSSPKLTAETNELQVWFRHIEPTARTGAWKSDRDGGEELASGGTRPDFWLDKKIERGRAYEMIADLLQLEINVIGILERGKVDTEVKNLTATGKVQFHERFDGTDGRLPFKLQGHRLHVRDADSPNTFISLTGSSDRNLVAASASSIQPLASIAAQGASLQGKDIRLDRAANRLWINSPGNLILLADRDLTGQPLAKPQQITIAWDRNLDFDGRDAVFTGNVHAHGASTSLRTERMTTTMSEPISFQMKVADRPDIARVACTGYVHIDRHEMDASGQIGQEHAQVASLALEWKTGAIQGSGPGWIRSVRYADSIDSLPIAGPLTGPSMDARHSRTPREASLASRQSLPAVASPSRLRFLQVHFQRDFIGNMRQRQLTAHGQVHAVYGPVDSWEQIIEVDGPGWRNGAMALDCDQLGVSQRHDHPTHRDWVEMTATGNVKIEGYTPRYGAFNAQAHRLTYDQRKDLLVLDGGPNGGRFWQAQSAGLPFGDSSFDRIMFWPSRNEVSADKVRSIEFHPPAN